MAQLELHFRSGPAVSNPGPCGDWIEVGTGRLPLIYVRHPRARRYVLRLQADGSARVTLPRRGNYSAARQFVLQNIPWLERRLTQRAHHATAACTWNDGTKIFFRGEEVALSRIEQDGLCVIQIAEETLTCPSSTRDLRPIVEGHFRQLAARELPARLLELAGLHGFAVRRISIRNQRSRWGSCSVRGTISLNWRLIQTPPFVSDYILLHELAHLTHMNHSKRYWAEVGRLCPDWREAEAWLKGKRIL